MRSRNLKAVKCHVSLEPVTIQVGHTSGQIDERTQLKYTTLADQTLKEMTTQNHWSLSVTDEEFTTPDPSNWLNVTSQLIGNQLGDEAINMTSSTHRLTFVAVPYILISIIGIAGNLIVILVIANFEKMRRRYANILILNQSSIDMAAAIMLLKHQLVDRTQYVNSDLLGELKCRLWLSTISLWSVLMSSTYNLMALTLDRYIAVMHPVAYRNSLSRKHALITCAVVWAIGPVYYLFLEIPTGGVVDGKCYRMKFYVSSSWKVVSGVVSFILQLVVPIFLFAYCYTRMVIALRPRVQPVVQTVTSFNVNPTAHHSNMGQSRLDKARRNILKTLIAVVISFIVCWSWNQTYFFASNIGFPIHFMSHRVAIQLSALVAFANCCINPIIYTFKYEMFQDGLRRLFCRKCTTDEVEWINTGTGGSAMNDDNNDRHQLAHSSEKTNAPCSIVLK